MITLNVNSEYGQLTDVILASIAYYKVTEPINITQEQYYTSNPPELTHLLEEQSTFSKVLESHSVKIHWANPIKQCPYQVNTRDIATVVGTTLVIGSPRREIRRDEINGIKHLFPLLKGNIIEAPKTIFLEGGDIILDEKCIYIGLGERTNLDGFEFVRSQFERDYEIIPLKLREGILHLDVVFNILPNRTCILYPDAFTEVSQDFFESRFDNLIYVTDSEQFDLSTNVFLIDRNTVITDIRNIGVNDKLHQQGFKLIELDFTHTTRIGGAFRCATLPLQRV